MKKIIFIYIIIIFNSCNNNKSSSYIPLKDDEVNNTSSLEDIYEVLPCSSLQQKELHSAIHQIDANSAFYNNDLKKFYKKINVNWLSNYAWDTLNYNQLTLTKTIHERDKILNTVDNAIHNTSIISNLSTTSLDDSLLHEIISLRNWLTKSFDTIISLTKIVMKNSDSFNQHKDLFLNQLEKKINVISNLKIHLNKHYYFVDSLLNKTSKNIEYFFDLSMNSFAKDSLVNHIICLTNLYDKND